MKKYWHMALFSTEMFFLILSASHFLFSEIFAVTQNYYKFWWNSTYEYLYLVNWYLNGIANTNFQIWRFEKSNLKIWKFKFEFWKIWICTWSLICYFYIYVFFFLGSCPVRVIKNRTLYVLRWNKMLKHCHAIWLRFGTNLHALSYLEWFENNNGEVCVRDYAFRVINLNRKMI